MANHDQFEEYFGSKTQPQAVGEFPGADSFDETDSAQEDVRRSPTPDSEIDGDAVFFEDFDDEVAPSRFHVMTFIAPMAAVIVLWAGGFAVWNAMRHPRRVEPGAHQAIAASAAPQEKTDSLSPPPSSALTAIAAAENQNSLQQRLSAVKNRSISPGAASRIIITSTPSGALIKANGVVVGRTPYTWNSPPMYGQIEFRVKKKGYNVRQKILEYTGGSIESHFKLEVESSSVDGQNTETEQWSSGEEPDEPPAPRVPLNPAAPAAKPQEPGAQTRVQSVKSASVFVSSIPPGAEVFIGGEKVGETNSDLIVPAGTYTMDFIKDGLKHTKVVTFTHGKNRSVLVRLK
jgi:hypothetical protein